MNILSLITQMFFVYIISLFISIFINYIGLIKCKSLMDWLNAVNKTFMSITMLTAFIGITVLLYILIETYMFNGKWIF